MDVTIHLSVTVLLLSIIDHLFYLCRYTLYLYVHLKCTYDTCATCIYTVHVYIRYMYSVYLQVSTMIPVYRPYIQITSNYVRTYRRTYCNYVYLPVGSNRVNAPSVSIGPGWIATKRMPYCPHSAARDFVIASTPALAHALGSGVAWHGIYMAYGLL